MSSCKLREYLLKSSRTKEREYPLWTLCITVWAPCSVDLVASVKIQPNQKVHQVESHLLINSQRASLCQIVDLLQEEEKVQRDLSQDQDTLVLIVTRDKPPKNHTKTSVDQTNLIPSWNNFSKMALKNLVPAVNSQQSPWRVITAIKDLKTFASPKKQRQWPSRSAKRTSSKTNPKSWSNTSHQFSSHKANQT